MYENRVIVYLSGSIRAYTGPIRSMKVLRQVISKRFDVIASPNLLKNATTKSVSQENAYLLSAKLLKAIKNNFIYCQLRDLYFAIKMNIEITVLSYKSDPQKVIITQPWLLTVKSSKIIYIRRVNLPESRIVSSSPILKIFEYLFFRLKKNVMVIYLCPQKGGGKKFIFNSFDFDNPAFDNVSVSPTCYLIGTFIMRKGSKQFSLLAKQFPYIRFVHIGTVPETSSKYVEFLGTTSTPYKLTEHGDILVSLSEVEGFQRTLVEAVINGMFVICNRREDTMVLSDLPTVFIIDEISEFEDVYKQISQMSMNTKRQILKASLEIARNRFSHEAVLQQWISVIEKS